MADGSIPGSGSGSAFEQAFERKVRLSSWALFFEALWPRVWAAIGVVALFLAVSLAGLWPRLPLLAHQLVLVLFAGALVAVFVWIARVRVSSRDEALRRVARFGCQASPREFL